MVILRGLRYMERPEWAEMVSNVDWDTSHLSWLRVPESILDPSPAQIVSALAYEFRYQRVMELFDVVMYQQCYGFESSVPASSVDLVEEWPSWHHWLSRLASRLPWHVRWRGRNELGGELGRFAVALEGHVAAMVEHASFTEDDCFFDFHFKVEGFYRREKGLVPGTPRWMMFPPFVTDRPGYESVAVQRWEYSPCKRYVVEPWLPHMSRWCAFVCCWYVGIVTDFRMLCLLLLAIANTGANVSF